MYRILHIPTGEFVYIVNGGSGIGIIGSRYRNILGWSPMFKSRKEATDIIIKIIKMEALTYWIENGACSTIKDSLKAEFEIIKIKGD